MDVRAWTARNLAARLLAGPWTLDGIATAIDVVIGTMDPTPRAQLATAILALAEDTYPPAPGVLTSALIDLRAFRSPKDRIVPVTLDPPLFASAPRFVGVAVPRISTIGALATWLDISPEQLDWLADLRQSHERETSARLRHYRYALVPKADGSTRLLEAPKPRLKAIQRRILRDILALVPVHDRAMGFVPGRSCLRAAGIHAGEAIVVAFDLSRFFASIARPRIYGLFRALGYPWAVAWRLAGLCTTVTPQAIRDRLADGEETYRRPHLPQGAPTSPALANLLAWRLDQRFDRLARSAGATYTRYADDLAFSGDATFAAGLRGFSTTVETIVAEEGFVLNHRKTRVMRRHQRQTLTGIVVNDHCNVPRDAFDALKAILFNCARHGPGAQNRGGVADFRRHLDGRVSWVEQVNPPRGAKLRALFDRIAWD
jgi:retron-type reverse transcriptase